MAILMMTAQRQSSMFQELLPMMTRTMTKIQLLFTVDRSLIRPRILTFQRHQLTTMIPTTLLMTRHICLARVATGVTHDHNCNLLFTAGMEVGYSIQTSSLN